MNEVTSTNPVTGVVTPIGLNETSRDEVTVMGQRGAVAAAEFAVRPLEWRAALLEGVANAFDEHATDIIATANEETGLGEARLTGELRRTSFQFRFFAAVVRDGGFLEASIDHAAETPMGPLPDLRRQLEPLGLVGVFGASNFPLAFSVPGGDTASALAAGCSVLVKAHPAHPKTSRLCFNVMRDAAMQHSAPGDLVQCVFGVDAGLALVDDVNVRAVGFTGSYRAGRLLFDRAQARDVPIPFYGELGSVNALVVTPAAARARAREIGAAMVSSVTLGSGQFCTKPGLLFVPTGPDGDTLVESARSAIDAGNGATMLSNAIREHFDAGVEALLATAGVSVLATSARASGPSGAGAVLVAILLESLRGPDASILDTECFGAVAIVVRYEHSHELLDVLGTLEPALTFSVHVEIDDELGGALIEVGRQLAGRIIVNGYPTGVGVSWSMHHGGPHPATTSALHTSVGATSIRRWLRPVSYQSVPDAWLPDPIKEGNPLSIIRRVDGQLRL
jgi:NADP-dependent aldehyde dehydrogenase